MPRFIDETILLHNIILENISTQLCKTEAFFFLPKNPCSRWSHAYIYNVDPLSFLNNNNMSPKHHKTPNQI